MALQSTPSVGVPAVRAARLLPLLYAAALLLSALLLFSVQPMFSKMVLPRLGGAPAVWSVAMVSFQAFLFVGYLYAHLLTKIAPPRAAMLHMVVLAVVALALPIAIPPGFSTPPTEGVTLWLLMLFTASIGLPFVALAATAPLLQSWFVASGHPRAANPYVLYAASNFGSFSALIAYPVVVEPFMSLRQQAISWSFGFGVLVAAIALCGCTVVGSKLTLRRQARERLPAKLCLSWMMLAAVPAGLGIAVTSYISTDLASAPFLWIVPLALYLLTFVAVFRDRSWVPHATALRIVPYAVVPLALTLLGGAKGLVPWPVTLLMHLAAFTVLALACHGEAYRLRPDASRLTAFYLWTALGGVLGGIFAGLMAPHLFNNIYEYPLLVVAALIVLPFVQIKSVSGLAKEAGFPLVVAALLLVTTTVFGLRLPFLADAVMPALLALALFVMLWSVRRPALFVGVVVLTFVLTGSWQPGGAVLLTARSFFGVHKVVASADGSHHLLYHGTTIHGAEDLRGTSARPEPLTYYYFGGPLSDVVTAARAAHGGHLARSAVVGLGTGSMACHFSPGEPLTFFEIDPEVIRIARRDFTFLSACASGYPIVLGDARLTLATTPGQYDLIVLDAFSSDAIPIHLLTREAFAGYLAHLAPGGTVAVHVSNRHLELAPIVAAVGAAEGLVAMVKSDRTAVRFAEDYHANAKVVVLARNVTDFGDLTMRAGWEKLAPPAGLSAWTDDYSDILRAILLKAKGA